MNQIKINNMGSIGVNTHSIDINSRIQPASIDKISDLIIILSEEEILNDNFFEKLRGKLIRILIIPKRFKYTFNETPISILIKPCLNEKSHISYY